MFAPSKEEVEWAVRVAIADDKASAAGQGAWTLDGKMVDAPVSGKARAIIKKAQGCGFDIESIKSQWQSQEPE
jgi:citrate lyase subunit beta-like protein